MIEANQKSIASEKYIISHDTLNSILKTLSIFIIFSSSLCIFYQFLTDKYSNDIYAFMYQGTRLLKGELLFTKEFNDKTPIIQFLFLLPAYFKSIKLWIFISTFIISISSFVSYKSISKILNINYKLNNNSNRYISKFASLLFLFLCVFSPAGIDHIDATASSFFLLAISSLIFSFENESTNKFKLILLATLFLGICISIRPYFLMASIILIVWSALKIYYKDKTKIVIYCFIFNSLLFFFIFALNFIPYFITGNLNGLFSALLIHRYDYYHIGILKTIILQIKNIIYFPNIGIIGFIVFFGVIYFFIFLIKCYKNNNSFKSFFTNNLDQITFFIILPFSVEILILKRHFWDHYSVFFAPFAIFTVAYIFANIYNLKLINFKEVPLKRFFILFALIFPFYLIYPLHSVILDINYEFKNLYVYRNMINNEVNEVRDLVNQYKPVYGNEISFLVPDSNFLHWRLSESRHGFPIASIYKSLANNRGTIDQLPEKLIRKNIPFVFAKQRNLCKEILDKSPELLLIKPSSFEEKCILSSNNQFSQIEGTYGNFEAYRRIKN